VESEIRDLEKLRDPNKKYTGSAFLEQVNVVKSLITPTVPEQDFVKGPAVFLQSRYWSGGIYQATALEIQ